VPRAPIIGVTGGIGAGKSAAVALLAERGAVVIDADRVGHECYLPGTRGWQLVVDEFGSDVVGPDGTIDRRRLGAIVFADSDKLARLNAIVHPLIRDTIAARIASQQATGSTVPIVVEAALLIEARWDALVDEVWVVVARPEVVRQRLVEQRGLAPEAIAARLRAQLGDDARTARADVVIDNSGTREALRERIAALWRERLEAP
jgi:dephospho-CoA kinase